MKKKAPEPADAMLEMLDRLLGPVEEMTADELTSAIAEGGLDLQAAREKLYARVSGMRSKAWERNADVTTDITSLLSQLRPPHLPTSDPKVAQRAAATWVRDLLERPRSASGPVEFAAAPRNLDGALADADQEILRELEDEVRRMSEDSD
ncbi:MAG: hypothetical protein IT184_14700 [Acidobacteria bacterium]|nr:hypothetical protein [Acidobacteriota bacterium]